MTRVCHREFSKKKQFLKFLIPYIAEGLIFSIKEFGTAAYKPLETILSGLNHRPLNP